MPIDQAHEKIIKLIGESNIAVSELIKIVNQANKEAILNIETKKYKDLGRKIAEKISNEELENEGIPEVPIESITQSNKFIINIFGYCSTDFRGEIIFLCEQTYYKSLLNGMLKRKEDFYFAAVFFSLVSESKDNIKIILEDLFTSSGLSNIQIMYEQHNFFNLFPVKNQNLIEKLVTSRFLKEIQSTILDGIKICIKDFLISIKDNWSILLADHAVINMVYHLLKTQHENNDRVDELINAFQDICNIYYIPDCEWRPLSINQKLKTYTILLLLYAELLPEFLPIPGKTFCFCIKYLPEYREKLRQLSKNFQIFLYEDLEKMPGLKENTFLPIKIIESVVPEIFNQFNLPETLNYAKYFRGLEVKNIFKVFECRIFNVQKLLSASMPQNIKFENISKKKSMHIIICVSGYLSEFDKNISSWMKLLKKYPESSIFSYVWDSSSLMHMAKNIFHYKKDYPKDQGFFSELLGRVTPFKGHFLDHMRSAVIAGKILAYILQNEDFAYFTISLVGFSLGTMVLLSCLEELSHTCTKKIHDLILMGSAIPKENEVYMQKFKNVVTGKYVNCYSENDWILKSCFKIATGESAFGSGDVKDMTNINVSSSVNGHTYYRNNFFGVFDSIENF
ncbi:hypothetical protein SteCoe_11573 [Stentor coeruleus]|uniref:Uncharacterized protein n=1 Tax=Stentor coeruleus TaxID=5963 RepID=A0A1R2CCS9_9CILI|nr:hypothetical protein SteCoe_11573 [Stentor coeruleus]